MSPGTRRRVARAVLVGVNLDWSLVEFSAYFWGVRSSLACAKQLSFAKRSRGWHGFLSEMRKQLDLLPWTGGKTRVAFALDHEIAKEIKRLADRDELC